MAVLRTFVALELPLTVQTVLAAVARRAAAGWPAGMVRWEQPERAHLTLRFLGDTDEALLPALRQRLDLLGASHPALSLALAPMGCFPEPTRPRVVWVGVADPGGGLLMLQRQVEQLGRDLGWQPERRRFQAHLTLGRVREAAGPAPTGWSVPVGSQPFQVGGITLFESRLRPCGAEYHRLHAAPLTAS